ncbi:MAG: [protein-PII] uridylyltransferase [Acidimicrobiaceae bacterium]|nr:[protein-PII] uridylyltransferase [Acidimicrobiaceae bacterium]
MSSGLTARIEQFKQNRSALLEQNVVDPRRIARELTELCDVLVKSLYPSPAPAGTALLALGSYADFEMTPNSDLDVVLLHQPKVSVDNLAQSIWYPLWDLGLKIDNSVRTPKEAINMAISDPRVLNGLCRPRLIVGDIGLVNELDRALRQTWMKKRKSMLGVVVGYAKQRHKESGELAYLLEPDIKDAAGGLRDFAVIKSLEYLEDSDLLGTGLVGIYSAQNTLQDTRVMLHLKNPRSSNRLSLQDQDSVAEALGFRDADQLMEVIAQAGKTISFAFDTISRRLMASTTKSSRPKLNLPNQLSVRGDEISLAIADGSRPTFLMLLKLAVVAGSNNLHISERSLEEFADANLETPKTFTEDEFQSFISFLSVGPSMIQVAEALDHFRLFEKIIPEWDHVRCKPQRNAYHVFTVDRHLLETVVNASQMRRRVKRPDLLLVAALLHDIGKGLPGDHTEAGVKIIPKICSRLGMNDKDADIIVRLVQNHLTLADTATRRDISDPTTINKVAEFLKEPLVVELLEVLTEADSRATGTSAWSGWKAKLVSELASKTIRTMEGLQPEDDSFPGDEFDYLISQAGTGWAMDANADMLKLVAPDKPGLFSLVTGTLALVGIDIVAARVGSKGNTAIENFLLQPPEGRPTDWNRFKKELQKNLDEPGNLQQRLQDKAKNYARARRRSGVQLVPPRVVVAPDASSRATVVEVWAPNRIGLLHDITAVIAQMSLSVSHAKILTMGDDVVDSFYLTDSDGAPISNPGILAELSSELIKLLDSQHDRSTAGDA